MLFDVVGVMLQWEYCCVVMGILLESAACE